MAVHHSLQFRHKGIEPDIAHDLFVVHAVGLTHNLRRPFSDVPLSHIFERNALVLDVLHLQIQQTGKLGGEHTVTLLVAVPHFSNGLVIRHFTDDTGKYLQTGNSLAGSADVRR